MGLPRARAEGDRGEGRRGARSERQHGRRHPVEGRASRRVRGRGRFRVLSRVEQDQGSEGRRLPLGVDGLRLRQLRRQERRLRREPLCSGGRPGDAQLLSVDRQLQGGRAGDGPLRTPQDRRQDDGLHVPHQRRPGQLLHRTDAEEEGRLRRSGEVESSRHRQLPVSVRGPPRHDLRPPGRRQPEPHRQLGLRVRQRRSAAALLQPQLLRDGQGVRRGLQGEVPQVLHGRPQGAALRQAVAPAQHWAVRPQLRLLHLEHPDPEGQERGPLRVGQVVRAGRQVQAEVVEGCEDRGP